MTDSKQKQIDFPIEPLKNLVHSINLRMTSSSFFAPPIFIVFFLHSCHFDLSNREASQT